MSRNMWSRDNPKIIVGNGNWITSRSPGQNSFRLGRLEEPWFVMRADTSTQLGDYHATHAEAIAYAQKEAKMHAVALHVLGVKS